MATEILLQTSSEKISELQGSLERRVNLRVIDFVCHVADGLVNGDEERLRILKKMSSNAQDVEHFGKMMTGNVKFGPDFVSDLRDATVSVFEEVFPAEKYPVFMSLVRDNIYDWATLDEESVKERSVDYMTGKIVGINAFANPKVRAAFTDQSLDPDHVFGMRGNVSTPFEDLKLRPEFVIEQVANHAGFEAVREVLDSSLEYLRIISLDSGKDYLSKRDAIVGRITQLSEPEVIRSIAEARGNGLNGNH